MQPITCQGMEVRRSLESTSIATTDDEVEDTISQVKDWQITHGSLLKLVRFETPFTVQARPIGVSLFPTPLRRRDFEEAAILQPLFNELYARAAADFDWLSCAITPLIEHDALCSALWDILLETRKAARYRTLSAAYSDQTTWPKVPASSKLR